VFETVEKILELHEKIPIIISILGLGWYFLGL